jgi:chemotaxis protein MotB
MKKFVTSLIAVGLIAGGCGVPKKKYNAQKELAEKLQAQLKEARAANTNLKSKIDQLDAQLAKLNNQMKEMESDSTRMRNRFRTKLQATQKELEELAKARKAAEQRAQMLRELTAKFRKLIDAGKLSIKIVHGRMVLKLKSAVLFDSGRTRLKRVGKKALAEIAKVLKTINKHFQVAGHTDDRPMRSRRYKSNWELSTARAVAVVKFLQKRGVNPSNLSAAGFSQYQPVARNKKRSGRRQNRRIEITLLPSIPKQLVNE